jgi:hypothetical protein
LSTMSSRMSSSRLRRKPIFASTSLGEKRGGIWVLMTGLSSSFKRSSTANEVAVAASSPATISVGANFFNAHRS